MASPVDQIINAESGGDPNATNPRSSATGAGQFINSTWADMMARYRPDLIEGKSRDEVLAMRNDHALSKEMTANYAAENAGVLRKNNLPVTPGTTYLSHFAGPTGAVGLLSADPSTPAGSILGPSVVKANPFLANMTAGDVAAWAHRKMGGVTAPMAPSAPMSLAPPAQPAQPQQQQPSNGFMIGGSGGSAPMNMNPQTPQLAPMLMPQRINLAQAYARR